MKLEILEALKDIKRELESLTHSDGKLSCPGSWTCCSSGFDQYHLAVTWAMVSDLLRMVKKEMPDERK